MLKKIVMVMLAAGTLAFNAPVASADGHLSGDCNLVPEPIEIGRSYYEGVLVGYGVNSTGGAVTVHCEVRVGSENAGPSAGTPQHSGNAVAVSAFPVWFTAAPGETVWICAVVSDGLSTFERCEATTHSELPPPGTWEQVESVPWVIYGVFDSTVCPVLARLAGDYGVVHITGDGDVWVGRRVYDCPP